MKIFCKIESLFGKQNVNMLAMLVGILSTLLFATIYSVYIFIEEDCLIDDMWQNLERLKNNTEYIDEWRRKVKRLDGVSKANFSRQFWNVFDEKDIEDLLKNIALSCGVNELSLGPINTKVIDNIFKSFGTIINATINSQEGAYRFVSAIESCIPGLVEIECLDIKFDDGIKKFVCKIAFNTVALGLINRTCEFCADNIPHRNLCLFGRDLQEDKPLRLLSVIVTEKSAKACINEVWYSKGDTIGLPQNAGHGEIQILNINNDGVTVRFLDSSEDVDIETGQTISFARYNDDGDDSF
ncbi:MAG: hypothetical protein LBI30_02000 [Holosporales bacterium]|jgi:hypothetical protein|nr:hypothetical protein [Holosporales bacterium]